MTFAHRLRKARESANISVAEAAKQAKVSPRTWVYWEDGKRTPSKEADAITQERILANIKPKSV